MREFVCAVERTVDEHNRDVALAWRIAALDRHKTLPSLSELLMKAPETLDQQVEAVMGTISVRTGRDPQRVRMVRTEDGRCQLISLN